jgi:hypothetical protein
MGETHVELRQGLDTKIDGVEARSVEMLDARVGVLQAQLDTKVSTVELNDLRTELNDRIDRISDGDVLSARVNELQAQLDDKVDNTIFREVPNDKVEVAEVASLRTEISTELASKVDTNTFDAALAGRVDSTTFTDRLSSL